MGRGAGGSGRGGGGGRTIPGTQIPAGETSALMRLQDDMLSAQQEAFRLRSALSSLQMMRGRKNAVADMNARYQAALENATRVTSEFNRRVWNRSYANQVWFISERSPSQLAFRDLQRGARG